MTFQYKVETDGEDGYFYEKPTEYGTYTVRATFRATDLYKEYTATATFKIVNGVVETPHDDDDEGTGTGDGN